MSYRHQLWNNVRFCMEHSRYAIAVFEQARDPAIIRTEISEFDQLFGDSVAALLGIRPPRRPAAEDFGTRALKLKIIKLLGESEAELRQLLKK